MAVYRAIAMALLQAIWSGTPWSFSLQNSGLFWIGVWSDLEFSLQFGVETPNPDPKISPRPTTSIGAAYCASFTHAGKSLFGELVQMALMYRTQMLPNPIGQTCEAYPRFK